MLLEVEDLVTRFFLDEGVLKAVDGVSFGIAEGETLGLVGESGCGKTIVALSLIDLVPWPGKIIGGKIRFEGEDLLRSGVDGFRRARGSSIGMVFQEPAAALNPLFTVGSQISEVLRHKSGLSKKEAESTSVRLLGDVGIKRPEERARAYPFELSGGMKQRVVLAIATCTKPRLLIADEPTTALDVSVKEDIVQLMLHQQQQNNMAILLITHDIGVVSKMAGRTMVMHTGKVVETAPTRDLVADPKHPYSQGLLNSVPRLGADHKQPLKGIEGSVPDFLELPEGCAFNPRCPISTPECTLQVPELRHISAERTCACIKVGD